MLSIAINRKIIREGTDMVVEIVGDDGYELGALNLLRSLDR